MILYMTTIFAISLLIKEETGMSLIPAIIFGFGALTEYFYLVGAWKKSFCAIFFWIMSNIFLGGVICWAIIPIIAKAIKEIKYEEKQVVIGKEL